MSPMTSSPYPHSMSVTDKLLTVLMYALAAGVAPWILAFPPVSYEGFGLVASVGWGILVGVGAVLMLVGELKRSHYVELPGVMLAGAGLLTYTMLSWEQTLSSSPGSGARALLIAAGSVWLARRGKRLIGHHRTLDRIDRIGRG